MFFHHSRFRLIECNLIAIATKLDSFERAITMAISDIKGQLDVLASKVQANTDATTAVTTVVTGLRDQIKTLQQELQDAIDNEGDVQAVSDKIKELGDSIDADTLATNALANTPAVPPESSQQ